MLAFPGECLNQLWSEVKSIPERSAGWFKTLDLWHRLMLCDMKKIFSLLIWSLELIKSYHILLHNCHVSSWRPHHPDFEIFDRSRLTQPLICNITTIIKGQMTYILGGDSFYFFYIGAWFSKGCHNVTYFLVWHFPHCDQIAYTVLSWTRFMGSCVFVVAYNLFLSWFMYWHCGNPRVYKLLHLIDMLSRPNKLKTETVSYSAYHCFVTKP